MHLQSLKSCVYLMQKWPNYLLDSFPFLICHVLRSMSKRDSWTNSFPRQKGRDLTQSYDKRPYTHRKIQKASWQYKNATKNFDYTTIADRLRTVSRSNISHPTGVVKRVSWAPTFPLTITAVQSNGHGSTEILFTIQTDFHKHWYICKIYKKNTWNTSIHYDYI